MAKIQRYFEQTRYRRTKVRYNQKTSTLVNHLSKLQSLRKEIQEVNWQRKDSQQRAGQKLNELEKR